MSTAQDDWGDMNPRIRLPKNYDPDAPMPQWTHEPKLSRNPDVTLTMTAEAWLNIISAADTYQQVAAPDDEFDAAFRLLRARFFEALARA